MKTILIFLGIACVVRASVLVEVANDSAAWAKVAVQGTTETGQAVNTEVFAARYSLGTLIVPDGSYSFTYYDSTGSAVMYASQAFAHEQVRVNLAAQGAFTYGRAVLEGTAKPRATKVAEWVRDGMIFQFAVEVASLCFLAFRLARRGGSGHLSGGGD